MFDNIDSVKKLYHEFLVRKWSWNQIDIDESHTSIVIQTWLKQGGHIAIGSPMVLWKYTNYPITPPKPKRKLNEVVGSLYAKVKQWCSVHWNNK